MKWIDLVGRRFKAFGGVYECAEYDRHKGLRMVLKSGEDLLASREIGDETWISERAIDRTYHEIYDLGGSNAESVIENTG